MNNMRKLMETVTLLEYLVRGGESIDSLLRLNVFGDTGNEEDGIVYGPNDVSWEEGELDPMLQKEWLRVVKPYAVRAKQLKAKIMKLAASGRTLSDVEADVAEETWYDGSDLYGELEFAMDELPAIWEKQIEIVADIIDGRWESGKNDYDDEDWDGSGDYAPFGEALEEDEYSSVANDDVERHIELAAKALAKDAVLQAAGVWDDEGREELGYDTGAKTGKEYIKIAAPGFLDDGYKAELMSEFDKHFHTYVDYFIEYVAGEKK